MICYKQWITTRKVGMSYQSSTWEGWFLFWFIPLYIRQINGERFIRR